jgi:hypothetical protein
MAIKNKDGSIFKLAGPPPVMENQTFWNEKVRIHNQFGQKYVQEAVKPENNDLPEKIEEPSEEIKIVDSIKEETPKYVNESIINVWCLPCTGSREVVDNLYGSRYGRPEYGEKFVFKAKLLEVEDLFIQMLAKEKIPEQSVIYPQLQMKRWWRVSAVIETNGFYVVTATISDYQPSFS